MNSIYLDADNGNDFSARLGDPSAPAKTLDAAFGLLDDTLRQGTAVTIYGRDNDLYTATARRAGVISLVGGSYDITLIAGKWLFSTSTYTATLRSVALTNITVFSGAGLVDLRGTLGNVAIYGGRVAADSITIPTTKKLELFGCSSANLNVTTSAGAIKAANSRFEALAATQTAGGTTVLYGCVVETDFEVNGQTVLALNCTHTAHTGTATLTNTGSTTIP